jgi:hypothetical protein
MMFVKETIPARRTRLAPSRPSGRPVVCGRVRKHPLEIADHAGTFDREFMRCAR